jgi:hypothetical protein
VLPSHAGAEVRKHFFFGKKQQETFIYWPRQPADKSFLVLFFKKEQSSSFIPASPAKSA